jgi:hypothetical protein
MNRFFAVRDEAGNLKTNPVDGVYYQYKADAKTFRNLDKGLFVTRGPDHWRGASKVND